MTLNNIFTCLLFKGKKCRGLAPTPFSHDNCPRIRLPFVFPIQHVSSFNPPPPAIGVRKPTVHIDKYQQILQINILDEKWVGIFNIKKWYKERKDKNERVQVDSFN